MWWKCHNCGHEWETCIKYRCELGTKCPNCMTKIGEGTKDYRKKNKDF